MFSLERREGRDPRFGVCLVSRGMARNRKMKQTVFFGVPISTRVKSSSRMSCEIPLVFFGCS